MPNTRGPAGAARSLSGVFLPLARRATRLPTTGAVLFYNALTKRLGLLLADGTEHRYIATADLGRKGYPPKLGELSSGAADGDLPAWDSTTATYLHRTWAEAVAREGFARNFLMFDDFSSNNQSGADIGSHPWFQTNNAGTGTIGRPGGLNAFGQWSEFGVIDFTSGAVSGDNTVWHQGINSRQTCQGPPPTGTLYEVKMQIPTASPNGERWCGMVSHETTYPDAALANTIRMIGFVTRPTGTAVNWFGICRNGTTETTVDLGLAADTTWRTFRWRKTATGVQFYKVVADVETAIGSVVTTNLPGNTNNQIPMFGVRAGTAAAQALRVDYVGLAGKLLRN